MEKAMTEEEMEDCAKRCFATVEDVKKAAAQEERIQFLMRACDITRDGAIRTIMMEDHLHFD